MPTLAALDEAAATVYAAMPPTPQYAWPLLAERTGARVWVKHENHTPVGSFKVRGGLVYLGVLRRRDRATGGVVAATRGNHGQSVAWSAARLGLPATVVVPHGNAREKNAAMRAQGAELLEHGNDFQEALEFAAALAADRQLHLVPSVHPTLSLGIASYALEFLRACPALEVVYVPIGMGSGICAVVAARDALGHPARIVGVVAEQAPAYALSFEAGRVVTTPTAVTMADGLACRSPDEEAVAVIRQGVERVVRVSEEAIAAAMRAYFTDTHNVAEGAAAAPLAALLAERERMAGREVGLVLTGGNVDRDVFARVLGASPGSGGDPGG